MKIIQTNNSPKNDIFQTNNLPKNDIFQTNNSWKLTFSKQIIRQKMTFSKEIIFLRGEGFGIFYTCEVFDVFELFEVGGGIKYA